MAGASSILAARSKPARPRRKRDAMPRGIKPPRSIKPMLATLASSVPHDADEWAFEFKWDGVRAVVYNVAGSIRIESRNRIDITIRYPELQALHDALDGREAVLDGEIVALDGLDRPSFAKLQRRMHVSDPAAVARLVRQVPILFVAFDLLYLDGRSLLAEPYATRRRMLEDLTLAGPSWQVGPSHVGRGDEMLEAARQNALEGIVAKRLDSEYLPGMRSGHWLKIKIIQRQEFVIAGWTGESTGLRNRIGTMLLGYYDCRGVLHYAGQVGTGLSTDDHAPLARQFQKLASRKNPFAEPLAASRRAGIPIHFLKPALVAEIEYRRWPKDGLVQQASFKGLRRDKPAKQVFRETPQE